MSGFKVIKSAAKQIAALDEGIDLLVASHFSREIKKWVVCTHYKSLRVSETVDVSVFKCKTLKDKASIRFEYSRDGIRLKSLGGYSTVDLYLLGWGK